MTKEEIVSGREKLLDKLAEAQAEVERVRLELRILQTRCKHKDKFKTCCMGESCERCPDCGWSS